MHTKSILQKILSYSQIKIHAHHINFLDTVLASVYSGAQISCASLGRHIKSKTTTKHNIKRVDYMLNSSPLQNNRIEIYKTLIKPFLSNRSNPRISIDWSSVNSNKKFHILRATLATRQNGGRGITIYEEVHPVSLLTNEKVHMNFLKKLFEITPINCKPIIITDAGFHSNWFKAVASL